VITVKQQSKGQVMGALRLAVGLWMVTAPKSVAGNADPVVPMLIRTIGVRDIALGLGTLLAPGASTGRWVAMGMASDMLDVLTGVAAIPSLKGGGVTAAVVPIPFVAGDLWALRGAQPVSPVSAS
jgi:hypothetical protein